MIEEKNTTIRDIITEEIIKDSRLFPLFSDTTKLLLQLFVLEIKNNINKEKKYEIVYGWCVRTSREETSDMISCSDFTKVYTSSNNITYSVAKVSIYNHPPMIIDLINGLLSGRSLKDVTINKLKTDKLCFDVFYTTNFIIRPVIFNETKAFISRNSLSKNNLTIRSGGLFPKV